MIPNSIPIWCVPSSLFCAWIYAAKTGRPVRIAIFNLSEGVDHAQAQCQDEDGEWKYLTEYWTGESMAAMTYGKNMPDAPEPYRYERLLDFILDQKAILNLDI